MDRLKVRWAGVWLTAALSSIFVATGSAAAGHDGHRPPVGANGLAVRRRSRPRWTARPSPAISPASP